MKRILWTAVAVIASLSLLAACDKKTEPAPADTKAAVAEPAKAEPVKVDPAQPSPKDMEAAAKAMADMGKGVDTSDAPEYAVKMIEHLKKINTVIKDNINDCDKTLEVLTKYMDENKADLEALKKAGDDAQAKMTPEEQQKLGSQMMALMGPIMQDMIGVQMQFQQKCQAQAAKLGELMQKSMGK
jgi:predicted outer membrane protein